MYSFINFNLFTCAWNIPHQQKQKRKEQKTMTKNIITAAIVAAVLILAYDYLIRDMIRKPAAGAK